MVRILLHSANATKDTDSQKWTFSLDHRISNPTRLVVNKITYTGATSATYPQVVYCRSDSLARLITEKHTIELTDNGHENHSNVLGVLHETHDLARYALEGRRRPHRCDPHLILTEIDIYFTDNQTPLAIEGDSSSSSAGSAAATDADIEAIGANLVCWIDMNSARMLDSSFAPAENLNDNVSYLFNRSPGPATLILANQYGSEMARAAVGSGAGVTRAGSWQSMADTSLPSATLLEEWCLHSLVVPPPTMGTFSYIIDNHMLKAFFWDGGTVAFKSGATGNNITPLRAYLITVERRPATIDHDGDGVISGYEFVWRFEDLVAGSVVTHITEPGNDHPGEDKTWRIGTASTHFSHIQGAFIVHNGRDATHIANSRAWLRSQYAGESTEEVSGPVGIVDATWFAELEIETR